MRLSSESIQLLRCPHCHGKLEVTAAGLTCTQPACAREYPIIDGIPALINEDNSIFRLDTYRKQGDTFYSRGAASPLKQRIVKFIPDYALNFKAAPNFERLANLLLQRGGKSRILVIGGSVFNRGMEPLLNDSFELIETDVSFGDRTMVILDSHDIPFDDASFDAVVAQAVLEHVLDPARCVAELHRVLKADGLIYAETPFLQPVHAGAYDFTRFTHIGHRRLFRYFGEIDSGAVVGPAVTFASAYCSFLTSFARTRWTRSFLLAFGLLTSSWIKWFDKLMIDTPGALDCAFGYYFLGKRAEKPLDDLELIAHYRGAIGLLRPR